MYGAAGGGGGANGRANGRQTVGLLSNDSENYSKQLTLGWICKFDSFYPIIITLGNATYHKS